MPCLSTTGLYYDRKPSGGRTIVKRVKSPVLPPFPPWQSPNRQQMEAFYQGLGPSPGDSHLQSRRSQYARQQIPGYTRNPYLYHSLYFDYPPKFSRPLGRPRINGSDSDDTNRIRELPCRGESPRIGLMEEWHIEPSAIESGNSPHPNSSTSFCEPRIPFVAAAQQLDSTVRRAIIFFDRFYSSFRSDSDGHRQHADKHLLDSLWKSKIRGSSSHPTRKYERKDNTPSDSNENSSNQQNNNNHHPNHHHHHNHQRNSRHNNHQNQYDNSSNNQADNNNAGPPPTPPDELFSFRELQAQVLHRITQLIRSHKPILASLAPSYNSTSNDYQHQHHHTNTRHDHGDEYFDSELDHQQRRAHAFSTLLEDIQYDYPGLKRAVEGMSSDHLQAKTAIRKLKILKQYLATYRIAWDERYVDDDGGGLDSDEED